MARQTKIYPAYGVSVGIERRLMSCYHEEQSANPVSLSPQQHSLDFYKHLVTRLGDHGIKIYRVANLGYQDMYEVMKAL